MAGTAHHYGTIMRGVGAGITISTVGVIPRMLTLPDDLPGINLALSLHAPNQHLRESIMPAAGPYPLQKLLPALDTYCSRARRKALVQYILLG